MHQTKGEGPEPVADVSVVIATRNRRALLGEAIDSVRQQRGVRVEIVAVDDASSDETWAFLCALKDVSAFRLQAHGGRALACKRALPACHGRFIMFLDDDDRLCPGGLQALCTALDRNRDAVAAVGARRDCFVEEGWSRRDVHPYVERVRPIFDELMFGWSAVSGQNIYRTDLIRELGAYEEGLFPCDDRDLWLRVARRGPVVLCPTTVMTYRIGRGQVRPPEIRRLRERVARKAIRSLPRGERRHALVLRKANALIDRAEDEMSKGSPLAAAVLAVEAVALAPTLLLSPLIGPWLARRLVGRAYHRLRGR